MPFTFHERRKNCEATVLSSLQFELRLCVITRSTCLLPGPRHSSASAFAVSESRSTKSVSRFRARAISFTRPKSHAHFLFGCVLPSSKNVLTASPRLT